MKTWRSKYLEEVPATEGKDLPGGAGGEVLDTAGSEVVEVEEADPVFDEFLKTAGEAVEPVTPTEGVVSPPPPAPPSEPAAPTPPAAPAATEASPEPAPAPAPPTPQPAPTVAAEPPAPPAPAPQPPPAVVPTEPVKAPEVLQQEREAARVKYVSDLEKEYAIPADQADLLLTSPEKALPALAARVHVNVAESVINSIVSNLPQFVSAVLQQSEAARRNEEEFFAMWPGLKDEVGRKQTERLMLAYLNSTPNAKREQAMREVGIMAMTTLQRPFTPTAQSAPLAPAPAAQPFVPAAPGGAAGVPGSRPKLGMWESLAEDLLQEDR